MSNVIDISFVPADASVDVYHNNQYVAQLECNGTSHRLHLDTLNDNVLELRSTTNIIIEILDITMFELGSNRLKFQGMCKGDGVEYQGHHIAPNSSWFLTYSYPVFTWLHKTLNFGWLLTPDKE